MTSTPAREVKLYIAASLDGYIARPDGTLDWLPGADGEQVAGDGAGGDAEDFGYADFVASVDTVLLGRATYEQVLGFGVPYPYADKHSVVFTCAGAASPLAASVPRRDDGEPAQITFTDGDPAGVVAELRREAGAHLWLCGGAELCAAFFAAELIDELILFVAPVLLGAGIALFPRDGVQRDLALIESRRFENGMAQLTYRRGDQRSVSLQRDSALERRAKLVAAVRARPDLPEWAKRVLDSADRCGLSTKIEVERKVQEQSYLAFLEEQVELAPRGPEEARLFQAKIEALRPFVGEMVQILTIGSRVGRIVAYADTHDRLFFLQLTPQAIG